MSVVEIWIVNVNYRSENPSLALWFLILRGPWPRSFDPSYGLQGGLARFSNFIFPPLSMLHQSGLSSAFQKSYTSSGLRPLARAGPTVTIIANPLSFTFCSKIFLTRLSPPFCSLSRLHFPSWHLSQLEIMYFFRYNLSKISSSPDYKLQDIRDPVNFVHLCDLCHLAHSRCSKDIC